MNQDIRLQLHPSYHAICLGFWHLAADKGLNYIRDLDCDQLAARILKTVKSPGIPKTAEFRDLLIHDCQVWLADTEDNHDNFWGRLFSDECETLRSKDFAFPKTLQMLQHNVERNSIDHNFPLDGILYLRSPLPACVLFEHPIDSIPATFLVQDTQSALGFVKCMSFQRVVVMEINATLSRGRTALSAAYGFFNVLSRGYDKEWHKLIGSSTVATHNITMYADNQKYYAQFA